LYVHDDDKVHFFDGGHKAVYGNGSDSDLVLGEQYVELAGNDDAYADWKSGERETVPFDDRHSIFRQMFLRDHLVQLIGTVLTRRQWQVFNARYFMNYKQVEIADMLGIGVGRSEERRQRLVQRILWQSIRKLQKKLSLLKEL